MATDRNGTAERATTGSAPSARETLTRVPRAAGAGQDSWQVGLETFAGLQRLWLDQWTAWTELGLAWLTPATARQLGERLEEADRGAAKREAEFRAGLDRVAADLHDAQQEAGRQQARALREALRDATGEQQAARTALDEALTRLDRRLDALAKTQVQQFDELKAALDEQERRLRAAFGARVRTAVDSIEAATPEDLEPLRDQVAALTRATTATRKEVAELGRELHDDDTGGQPRGGEASSKESEKRQNA